MPALTSSDGVWREGRRRWRERYKAKAAEQRGKGEDSGPVEPVQRASRRPFQINRRSSGQLTYRFCIHSQTSFQFPRHGPINIAPPVGPNNTALSSPSCWSSERSTAGMLQGSQPRIFPTSAQVDPGANQVRPSGWPAMALSPAPIQILPRRKKVARAARPISTVLIPVSPSGQFRKAPHTSARIGRFLL